VVDMGDDGEIADTAGFDHGLLIFWPGRRQPRL